jgi:hypothetical protein
MRLAAEQAGVTLSNGRYELFLQLSRQSAGAWLAG